MNIDRVKDYFYIAGCTIVTLAGATVACILARAIGLFAKRTFSGMNFSHNNRIFALATLGMWSVSLTMLHVIEIFSNRVMCIAYSGRNSSYIQSYRWSMYPPFVYLP